MPTNNNSINSSVTAFDREPLLSVSEEENEDEVGRWNKNEYTDSNGNRIFKKDEDSDDKHTRIQLQFPSSEKITGHNHFPKERRKTFLSFGFLVLGFIFNSVSIALTHQKIPDRTKIPPLPDIFLDNYTKIVWFNDIADIFVICGIVAIVITILLHRYRWIVGRRVFIMLGLLYTMRSVTMYVTVLPLANTHVHCSPKHNFTSAIENTLWVTESVLQLFIAGGLPITGKKNLCGDYIYSGHTIIFMMAYLLIREYSSKRLLLIQWIFWGVAWGGMFGLLISHGHYTIDIIIGYYATSRMFMIYHSMANNPSLKVHSKFNYFSDVWWFPLFTYFERNVGGSLPREFSIPRLNKNIFLGLL